MRPVTALKMWEDGVGVGRLSFGCKVIDKICRGGMPLQGINEIVGEAGAGKTQFALTLSLQCHLLKSMGGLGGSTAYLCCGEGTFPVRRLEQLSHSCETKSGIPYTEFMDSVHIEQCHNADDVLDTLVRSRTDFKSSIEYITVCGRNFDHH
jgi:RecA/RadA recombinase